MERLKLETVIDRINVLIGLDLVVLKRMQ